MTRTRSEWIELCNQLRRALNAEQVAHALSRYECRRLEGENARLRERVKAPRQMELAEMQE